MKKKIHAFTLLELMLVILVILVFLVLMADMPTLTRTREQVSQMDCICNLSQIGKAFHQYAMAWDDWYPTTADASGFDKWMTNAKSLDLLRSQDLLTDPKGYLCPSFKHRKRADNNTPLMPDNVSYVWYEGLRGKDSALSAVASDGYTNHTEPVRKFFRSTYSGRFVRGDGSVAHVKGRNWTDEMRNNDKLTAENGTFH